jgi:hypothetical protein
MNMRARTAKTSIAKKHLMFLEKIIGVFAN